MSQTMSQTQSNLKPIYKALIIIGILLLGGSLYFRSWNVSVGVLIGLIIGAINLRLIQKSVGGLLAAGRASSAGTYVAKMAALFLAFYVLISVLGLDALGLATGYSGMILALLARGSTLTGEDNEEIDENDVERELDNG